MDDLSGKLGVEGDHEAFAGASSGPRSAGPRQAAPGALGELLERTWSTWRKALREEEDQYTARVFTPFTREGKPVGAFELASGSGHGDGDGLDGIKALSRLGDHDPFGLWPFHLHALIRSTIRGAEGDTDDRWSERDRKRAAERALAALGERWRAGAAGDRLLLSGCLRQGLALARDFALEPGWLTDAAWVYVGDSVWEPLAPPTRNDADGMRSTAAACPTTAADTKRRPCG